MTVRSELVRILDALPLLGGRVYADEVPSGETMPNAVVMDAVAITPELVGDGRAGAWSADTRIEVAEAAENATEGTRDAVVDALDGARVAGAFHLRVVAAERVYDRDRRVARTLVTIRAVRSRAG